MWSPLVSLPNLPPGMIQREPTPSVADPQQAYECAALPVRAGQ